MDAAKEVSKKLFCSRAPSEYRTLRVLVKYRYWERPWALVLGDCQQIAQFVYPG